MIGLVFATFREARPFLLASRAQTLEDRPFPVLRADARVPLRVTISGMGKVAAAAAAQALILTQKVTRLVNAGACGALRDSGDLSIGRLVQISQAVEGDHEVFGQRHQPIACFAPAFLQLPAMRLVTSDRPVFDIRTRTLFAELGDVVDMEGAAVARVAAYYQTPCTFIKGITDTARPLDRKTLLENLSTVSEQIAQKIWEMV